MVFFRDFQGWKLENSRTVTQKCEHCGNTSEHFVYVAPYGPQLGIIFVRKPLVGMRKYYLACSVCGWISREIGKEQALAMRA